MARASLPIIASGESGLSHYLTEIRKFPMLAPDEEFMLAKRYKEHGDRDAAHQLVTSHLRLVAKIAMGYRGYGLPIGEVISDAHRKIPTSPCSQAPQPRRVSLVFLTFWFALLALLLQPRNCFCLVEIIEN